VDVLGHGGRDVSATGAKTGITETLFVFVSFTLVLPHRGKMGRSPYI
jgi:hypothetical protein